MENVDFTSRKLPNCLGFFFFWSVQYCQNWGIFFALKLVLLFLLYILVPKICTRSVVFFFFLLDFSSLNSIASKLLFNVYVCLHVMYVCVFVMYACIKKKSNALLDFSYVSLHFCVSLYYC